LAIKRYNGTTGQWEFVGHPGSITPAAIGAVPTSGSSTISGNLTVSSLNSGQLAGFRNVLINGSMDIWQRGAPTTASPTAVGGASVYTADRWNVYRGGFASGASWSQQSTPAELLADFRYALRVQRVSGDTSTAVIACAQHVETSNAWALRGKTVSYSFYARRGANYSPTSSLLTVQLVTGTGTDETVRAGMTNQTTALNGTATLTTSWQRFTYTTTLSNVMTSLSALVASTPVGTAGANDWFEITGVQLEISPVATPFEFLPTGTELALCQRYYINIVEPNNTTDFNFPVVRESTTTAVATVFLPTTMRTRPSTAGSNLGRMVFRDTSFNISGVPSVSGISVSNSGPTLTIISLNITHGAVGGGGVFAEWDILNTTVNFALSAEL
jgi:hypothetical protein